MSEILNNYLNQNKNFLDLDNQLQNSQEHQLFHFLQSIPIDDPDISQENKIYYHKEPIFYEYYLGKERKITVIKKYLYIPLFDPMPDLDTGHQIMQKFRKDNEPITLNKVMTYFPEHLTKVIDLTGNYIRFYEKLAQYIDLGFKKKATYMRDALYLTEFLLKKEPSNISLLLLGDYIRYNLNWYIRYLNQKNIQYSLEDFTLLYLMKTFKENVLELSLRNQILSKLYVDNL